MLDRIFSSILGRVEILCLLCELGFCFTGVCLGMQCAVIEFARNELGMKNAHSTEANPETPHPVVCCQHYTEASLMPMKLGPIQ